MIRRFKSTCMTVALGVCATTEFGVTQDVPTGESTAPSLDLRISPLMDLIMLTRALAEQVEPEIPHIEGMSQAVAACRAVQESLGGSSGWGVFLGPLSSAETADEMLAICDQFPEEFNSRSGGSFNLREVSTVFARGIAAAEKAFLADAWPARQETLERRRDVLLETLRPKERAIFESLQVTLAVTDPQPVIPVYLVNEAPWPGAMTFRSRAGGVCIVGSDGGEGSQLLETVIHESLHALDATSSTPDVFDQLRSALVEAGVPRTDDRIRDLPHMVMFVHGAETVRRMLDPVHVDYGELEMFGRPGLYARDKASVDAVRLAWRAYLDGEITRDEALRRIVEKATTADE